MRRLTCRSSRSSSRRPARSRISGIELAPVVDDDADGRAAAQRRLRPRQHGRDPRDVLLDRRLARSARGGAELALAPVVEPEQLVGVAMLLVVVDQARIRRRGDRRRRTGRRARARARPRAGRPRRGAGRARPRTPRSGQPCRPGSASGTCRRSRPAGRCAGACGTSTRPAAARAGSRGRSASSAAPSAPRGRARPAARPGSRTPGSASGSGAARPRPAARTSRARSPVGSSLDTPSRPATSRTSAASVSSSCSRVLTEIRSALKAAMSTPTASYPDSSACTSVVPEPANGSSTRPPGRTYRSSSASTSCGTNLPRYGCSRWTCFVRSRSGSSRSDQESARSSSP